MGSKQPMSPECLGNDEDLNIETLFNDKDNILALLEKDCEVYEA
jgi:hypothetical protein